MKKFYFCFSVSIFTLTNCASSNYKVQSGKKLPPFNGVVLVFKSQIPPNVKYSIVGSFTEQKQFYGSTGQTSIAATREAAQRGANGILIEQTGVRPSGFAWASPYTEGRLLWIENYDDADAILLGVSQSPRPASTSAGDRLEELDNLHKKGILTDSEYEAKRKTLVNAL